MSNALAPTLTEFLLARIADDEAPTFELVPYACDPGCCAPAGWVGHRCLICGTPTEYGGTVAAITDIAREHEEQVHRRSRTLAECEAKREAIEAAWRDQLRIEGEWGSISSREQMSAANDNPAVIEWLATAYADHPDYRDDWRP